MLDKAGVTLTAGPAGGSFLYLIPVSSVMKVTKKDLHIPGVPNAADRVVLLPEANPPGLVSLDSIQLLLDDLQISVN